MGFADRWDVARQGAREGTMAKKEKKHQHGEGNGAGKLNGAMCVNGTANGSANGRANGHANGHDGGARLRLGKDCDYERELRRLQVELVKLQEWIRHEGLRVVVLFEGRDAAGKGGAIKRIAESLNPRVCRIAALGHADGAREDAMVFSAVCGAFAGGGRDGAVRSKLV